MAKSQRRLIRLHRRALRRWSARKNYWLFEGMAYPVRLTTLARMHQQTKNGEPGMTLGMFSDWWN